MSLAKLLALSYRTATANEVMLTKVNYSLFFQYMVLGINVSQPFCLSLFCPTAVYILTGTLSPSRQELV